MARLRVVRFFRCFLPLSLSVRPSSMFKGIINNHKGYRVSLYADDLVLYVINLAISVIVILRILNNFSSLSAYKLNLYKSVFFPITEISYSHGVQFRLPPQQRQTSRCAKPACRSISKQRRSADWTPPRFISY